MSRRHTGPPLTEDDVNQAEMTRRARAIDADRPFVDNPTIMAMIKGYDDRLFVYWDKSISRYCIARRGDMQTHLIAVWQGENGEFLPLDHRMFEAICRWDMRPPRLDAPKSADALADRMDAEDIAKTEKIEKDFEDDIDHLTKDNRRLINQAIDKVI